MTIDPQAESSVSPGQAPNPAQSGGTQRDPPAISGSPPAGDPPTSPPPPDHGKQLISIMSKELVTWLAVGSVVLGVLLIIGAILWPTLLEGAWPRALYCLLIALLFAVFVFVLYPSDYRIDLGAYSIPLVLVGPAALWIGLFFVFKAALPQPVEGRAIRANSNDERLIASVTWPLKWTPRAPPTSYELVGSSELTSGDLEGFYVEFEQGVKEYELILGVGPDKDHIQERYTIKFARDSKSYDLNPGRSGAGQ